MPSVKNQVKIKKFALLPGSTVHGEGNSMRKVVSLNHGCIITLFIIGTVILDKLC